MLSKFLLFLSAFLLQSLPLSLTSLLFLLVLGIWLYGQTNLTKSKALSCTFAFLLLKGVSFLIPTPVIEEGHNVFVPTGTSWAPGSQIPENIQKFIVTEFDRAFPKSKRCDHEKYGCWRFFKSDQGDFAWSADGFFQKKLYSRQVTSLHHDSLASARIGTLNQMIYNYFDYESDLKRQDVPYYVYYQIPRGFAGSSLTLKGSFFIKDQNSFIQHTYEQPTLVIIPSDGLGLYGVKIAPSDTLIIKLDKNLYSALCAIASMLVTIVLPAGLLIALFRWPSWSQIRLPIFSVGSFFLACLILRPSIFMGYPILPGGGDGLVYEGYGRIILEALSKGNIIEALRAGESVYYFMPGLRYFKAIEKALVGESFMLSVCVISFLGLFFYRVLRNFLSQKLSFWLMIIFCFTPIFERFGFTGYIYAQKIYAGFGEPLAIMLFMVGTSLMMKSHLSSEETQIPSQKQLSLQESPQYSRIFLATLAFSLSAFIRPAYLAPIGAFTAVYFFTDLVKAMKNEKIFKTIGAYTGYSLLLIMPAHNWFFGGEFVLTTSAAFHPVNLKVTLEDYSSFFLSLLTSNLQNPSTEKVIKHLGDWNGLSDSYRFLPLFFVFYYAFRRQTLLPLRALSFAAIVSHAFLLFYIPVGRYAYLAWTLTLMVFFYACEKDLYPKVREKRRRLKDARTWPLKETER